MDTGMNTSMSVMRMRRGMVTAASPCVSSRLVSMELDGELAGRKVASGDCGDGMAVVRPQQANLQRPIMQATSLTLHTSKTLVGEAALEEIEELRRTFGQLLPICNT